MEENLPEQRALNMPLPLTWDDIKVGNLIGSGGFASVYRVDFANSGNHKQEVPTETDNDSTTTATCSTTDCFSDLSTSSSYQEPQAQYVVKCLSSASFLDKTKALITSNGLVREAAILTSVPPHRNITRLVAISTDLVSPEPGKGFLVFERVVDTLDKVLKRAANIERELVEDESEHERKSSGEQQIRRVRRYANGIARGMKFLHQHNVLHRDLKPSNVGIAYDQRVRLMDFGCARRISNDSEGRLLTTNVGTARYMAPEVDGSCDGDYGFPADVYSFAILFWELLVLRKAFVESGCETQKFNREAVRVGHQRPSLDEITSLSIRKLLDSSWDANPDKRPPFSFILDELEKKRHKEEGKLFSL